MILTVGLILWPPTAKSLMPNAITDLPDGRVSVDAQQLVQRLFDPAYLPVLQQSIQGGAFLLDVRRTAPLSSLLSATEEFIAIWSTRHSRDDVKVKGNYNVYGIASIASKYPPLYLVAIGKNLDLPHRHKLGNLVVVPGPKGFEAHLHNPIMPWRTRLLTPVKYMSWSAFLTPVIVLGVFFEYDPPLRSTGFWSRVGEYLTANVEMAVVLAFVGAAVGLCIGTFVAIRGWGSSQ